MLKKNFPVKAEHMLDRMIVEHLMRVMRDKGPRLVAEDLVDNMVNRWLIQFYVQLFPDGQ